MIHPRAHPHLAVALAAALFAAPSAEAKPPGAAPPVPPPAPAPPTQALAAPSPEPSMAIASEPLEVTIEGETRAPDTFTSSRAAGRVTETDIHDASPGSIADALRHHAGVSVQQTTPGQGTIYVRGLSGREVMHVVDGIPLNATFFRAGNNPYLGLVDPYSLEEIDVIRGASSVIYGSDALGGVVSMVTALPGYALSEGGVTRARAFQSFSTNPLGAASRISMEHSATRWTAHLGFTYYRAGDIRPGEGVASPNPEAYWNLERAPEEPYLPATTRLQRGTSFEMYAGNAAFRRRISDRSEVVLRGQLGYRPSLSRYDEITPRFKREFPARAESAISPFYRTMLSAALVHRPRSPWIDEGIVQIGWQRLSESLQRRRLAETCFDAGAPLDRPSDACPGVLRLVPSAAVEREHNRSDAVTARGELRLLNAARTRGARIGIDATYDRVTSEADVYDPAVLEKQPQPERYPTGSSMTHGGVYGQAEAELVHGLRAHAGVRQALFHLDIPKRSVDEDSSSPAFTNTMVDVVFNAGVRWEFAPGVAWIVNAGRGVRSPNVQDFAALGPRAGNRFQIPNPDVGPEHTLSIDTGLKTLIDRISAEVAIFYLAYDDAIALAPAARDGSPTTPDGEQYEWSENASRVEYYGVEGEFGVPLARYAGISGRLLAMIGTQYNEQRTGLPAKTPADRAPPPQASVRVWAQPVPRLRIEATANGRLAQDRLNDPTNVEDNRIPENGTPGYVTLHLRGAFRVSNKITARLALDNLTDELVLEHGSGFYRPGFSATSSLDVSF